MTRGLADVLYDVVGDLRDTQAIVEQLPERQAIYQGHPTDDRGYPVAAVVTPIYDGSRPHRGAVSKDYRIQVTVVATRGWRESKSPNPGGLTAMYRILDAVSDRLDLAKGVKEIPLGGESGSEPQLLEDGRLAAQSDWRVSGTYLTQ